MKLARVLGSVVSTVKHPAYEGEKILLCQPLSPNGEDQGKQMIAVDSAQAGPGDRVLILTEGNGVRQILGRKNLPIRSVIVGIVDAVVLGDGGAP